MSEKNWNWNSSLEHTRFDFLLEKSFQGEKEIKPLQNNISLVSDINLGQCPAYQAICYSGIGASLMLCEKFQGTLILMRGKIIPFFFFENLKTLHDEKTFSAQLSSVLQESTPEVMWSSSRGPYLRNMVPVFYQMWKQEGTFG